MTPVIVFCSSEIYWIWSITEPPFRGKLNWFGLFFSAALDCLPALKNKGQVYVKSTFDSCLDLIKVKHDNLVKSRIFPFFWIPAFAGMTIIQLISDIYNRRHTREGGYPVFKTTFYDSLKHRLDSQSDPQSDNPPRTRKRIWQPNKQSQSSRGLQL